MTLLGIRDFAKSPNLVARMGRAVAPSTVTRWGQDGKIVLVDGRVDVAASLARLEELGVSKLRPDVAHRHAEETAHAPQTAAPLPGAQPAPETPPKRNGSATPGATDTDLGGLETGGANKAKYKAAVLHFENALIKLGMQTARGQRYYLRPVKDEAQALGNTLRAAVERLIDQTAPRLAILSNHMDRGNLLRRELRDIKRLIDRENTQALRRLRRISRQK